MLKTQVLVDSLVPPVDIEVPITGELPPRKYILDTGPVRGVCTMWCPLECIRRVLCMCPMHTYGDQTTVAEKAVQLRVKAPSKILLNAYAHVRLLAGVHLTLFARAPARCSSLVAMLGRGAEIQLDADAHIYASSRNHRTAQRRAHGTEERLQTS